MSRLTPADAATIAATLANIAERPRPVPCPACDGAGLTGWPRTCICVECGGSGTSPGQGGPDFAGEVLGSPNRPGALPAEREEEG